MPKLLEPPQGRVKCPDLLHFSAPVEIELAKEGEGEKPPTLKMSAYTGKPVVAAGFYYPVILDLSKTKYSKGTTPIIMDHDRSKRIGHTTSQSVDQKGINATGVVSSTTQTAVEFTADAKAGFPFQMSVGAQLLRAYEVAEGDSVQVNGKTWNGPLIVGAKNVVHELSVTVLGADTDTKARVAASFSSDKGIVLMDEFQQWCDSMGLDFEAMDDTQRTQWQGHWETHIKAKAPNGDPPKPTKTPTKTPTSPPAATGVIDPPDFAATRTAYANEDARIANVTALFSQYADTKEVSYQDKTITIAEFRHMAINDGLSPMEVENTLMRSSRAKPRFDRPQRLEFGHLQEQAMEVCLLRNCTQVPARMNTPTGVEFGYEVDSWMRAHGLTPYSPQVLEAADKMPKSVDLHYLMDLTIQLSGEQYTGSRNSDAFVRAFFRADQMLRAASPGLGGHALANILSNVANKAMLASYTFQDTVWAAIVAVKTLNDFKQHSFYRLDTSGGYVKIGPDGSLGHMAITDAVYTLTADTYGQMLVIGRKQLRNDDLDALTGAGTALGRNAAIAIEEAVFNYLLTNRANYVSTVTADLGIDGITSAEQAFRDQVDGVGRPILVAPDRVVVGTQDAVTAKDLFATRNLMVAGSGTQTPLFQENPHLGKYRPYSTPYLNNTAIRMQDGNKLTNQDSNQWFMMGPPAVLAGIFIGFLDGRTVPFFESDDMPFEFLGGIRFKSFHDWGIGAGDTKAILFSAGTG